MGTIENTAERSHEPKVNNLSDNDLMRNFSNCSLEAFNTLYNRYKNKLLNYVSRIFFIDKIDAEDIVQTALIKVYMYKFKYRHTYNFSTWIYTIIKNLSLNYLKNAKKTERINNLDFKSGYIDPNYSIDSSDVNDYKLNIINNQINLLPVKYREVLVFRYVEGLSFEEISQRLDINVNTLKSLAKRGLQKLKDSLKNYNFEL